MSRILLLEDGTIAFALDNELLNVSRRSPGNCATSGMVAQSERVPGSRCR
jgi:hypothetical protein